MWKITHEWPNNSVFHECYFWHNVRVVIWFNYIDCTKRVKKKDLVFYSWIFIDNFDCDDVGTVKSCMT